MTMTDADALEAMLAHHRDLEDGVARRVAAVHAAVTAGGGHEAGVAGLIAYMAGEVLPHALAEEKSIYEAARRLPGLSETVAAMVDEHRKLETSLETLASSRGPVEAGEIAASVGAMFTMHVAKENDLLLPALQEAKETSLAVLLDEMRRLIEEAHGASPPVSSPTEVDTVAGLLGLILEAGDGLAVAGRGDQACRVVASAWALLPPSRPDLAVRLTAALHRLVRTVTAEPVAVSARPTPGASSDERVLDVRSLAPAQRHESIFAAYGALSPGAGFVLVNDHDPKPLRYQFEAEHAGGYTWQYLESGPRVWRVRIGRLAGVAT